MRSDKGGNTAESPAARSWPMHRKLSVRNSNVHLALFSQLQGQQVRDVTVQQGMYSEYPLFADSNTSLGRHTAHIQACSRAVCRPKVTRLPIEEPGVHNVRPKISNAALS